MTETEVVYSMMVAKMVEMMLAMVVEKNVTVEMKNVE